MMFESSPRKVALFFVATLVGVFGGWALIEEPPETPEIEPAARQERKADPSSDIVQQPVKSESIAPNEFEVGDALIADDSFDKWLASRPMPKVSGSGVIYGKVTRDGVPQADISVKARPIVVLPDVKELSIRAQILARVKQGEQESAGTRTVQTDSEGDYRFEDLAEQYEYRFTSAQPEQYLRVIDHKFYSGAAVNSEVNLEARERRMQGVAETTQVEVKLSTAEIEVTSCMLDLKGNTSRSGQITTQTTRSLKWNSDHPVVDLPLGDFEIKVRHPQLSADPIEVNIYEGMPPILFELQERTHLAGALIGWPLLNSSARAELRLFEKGVEPSVEGGVRLVRVFGSRLNFNFDIEPGSYVIALISGKQVMAQWVAEVMPGFNPLELHYVDTALVPKLRVEVIGPDGRSDPNTKFSVRIHKGSQRTASRVQVLPHDGGAAVLQFDPSVCEVLDGKAEGKVFLNLNSSLFGSMETEIFDWEPVRVEFEPTASCEFDIPGYLGSGFEGALFFDLYSKDTSSLATLNAQVNWLGEANIQHVPPGNYELRINLRKDGSRFESQRIGSQEIRLAVGENRVQVILPILYELLVRFDEALVGESVSIRKDGRRLGGSSQLVKAELLFKDLSEGEYIIQVGIDQMNVRIPDQREVSFTVELVDTIVFEGIPEDSKTYAAGLRSGDWVIGANGVKFTERMQIMEAFQGARGKGSITLIISRNGTEFEVSLTPDDFDGLRSEPKFIKR